MKLKEFVELSMSSKKNIKVKFFANEDCTARTYEKILHSSYRFLLEREVRRFSVANNELYIYVD